MTGDQRAKWKAAIAEHAKAKRRQRRDRATPRPMPGMIRASHAEADTQRATEAGDPQSP